MVDMHLLPLDRASRPLIDEHRACEAVAGIPADLHEHAQRFAILGDPTRLAILLSIRAAGPIAVSDIAAAVDQNDTTVSQALRQLRAQGVVTAERDGRVVRYSLTDPEYASLLEGVGPV
jgi:DNA-binding transcriptional ArsR family regulator